MIRVNKNNIESFLLSTCLCLNAFSGVFALQDSNGDDPDNSKVFNVNFSTKILIICNFA